MAQEKRKEFLKILRTKNKSELLEDLQKYLRQRFALVVKQKCDRDAKGVSEFKVLKHKIARIKTVLGELTKKA